MRRKKTMVIIVMCTMIFVLSLAYALLSTNVDISGSTVVTSTWKVEFSDIRTIIQKGGATNSKTPTVNKTTATFGVDLVQPGDEIVYEIDITNYGDIKAEIKGATYAISGSEAIYVKFDGIRKGQTIESCEELESCNTITATLTIGYDPTVTKDPTNKSKDVSITLEIGQYVDTNPTPDGELIPELTNNLLVQQILRDNTVTSDGGIDFSKKAGNYYVSENISSVTGTLTELTEQLGVSSTGSDYMGSSYTFNETDGTYTISNLTDGELGANYTAGNKYACFDSTNTVCSTMYEMTAISGDAITTTDVTATFNVYNAKYLKNGVGLLYTSTNTENNMITYYFRGDVTNNYVKFGKYKNTIVYGYRNTTKTIGHVFNSLDECNADSTYNLSCTLIANAGDDILWRIVRINEDGSIRLISNEFVGTAVYNDSISDNTYVGYMYGQAGASSYNLTHTNTTDSVIKGALDNWYISTLLNYSSYIADTGFCNDRTVASRSGEWTNADTALGYGTNTTYYAGYNRFLYTKTPKFSCSQTNDLFTTKSSAKGNKKLQYPIGLLTIDEAVYAGATSNLNYNYYLINNNGYWWTISPGALMNKQARVYYVVNTGRLVLNQVVLDFPNVRPVINLSSNVEILEGDGSLTTPYVIKTS